MKPIYNIYTNTESIIKNWTMGRSSMLWGQFNSWFERERYEYGVYCEHTHTHHTFLVGYIYLHASELEK